MYIHFTDNNSQCQTNTNKYWNIRPLIDALHHSFHLALCPGEHLAIDEIMALFMFFLFR